MRKRICGSLVLACCLVAKLVCAQTEGEQQQLKEKVQQLEQLTEELKARIAVLEETKPGTPKLVNATLNQPSASQPAPQQETGAVNESNGSSGGELALATVPKAQPQTGDDSNKQNSGPRMDLYGFIMLDAGYDAGQNDPNWFDVMRPTKLPAFANEFGDNGRYYTGVRQTRFGVKAYLPTSLGELKTIFEYELFGVGNDAGETTFRLRHAWAELGQVGAGSDLEPVHGP